MFLAEDPRVMTVPRSLINNIFSKFNVCVGSRIVSGVSHRFLYWCSPCRNIMPHRLSSPILPTYVLILSLDTPPQSLLHPSTCSCFPRSPAFTHSTYPLAFSGSSTVVTRFCVSLIFLLRCTLHIYKFTLSVAVCLHPHCLVISPQNISPPTPAFPWSSSLIFAL
jgi:hypothetical protein